MPIFGYWPAFVGYFPLQKSARFAAKSKPGFFVTAKAEKWLSVWIFRDF